MDTYGKRLVLMETEVPDEVVAKAQVVMRTARSVHIVGPAPYRMALYTAKPGSLEVPPMKCPTIHTDDVEDRDLSHLLEVFFDVTKGIEDVAGFIRALRIAGAVIEEPSND